MNYAFSASLNLKRKYSGKILKDKENFFRKVKELKVKANDDNNE